MRVSWIFVFSVFLMCRANAEIVKPKQYGSEKRFKAWTYRANGIYYFEGHYMNPTYIEFDDSEKINTIYSPKPESWQFVPMGSRLFLKAVAEDADTTLTVMTDKRVYFFELHAKYATGPFDPDLTFFVKFRYSTSEKEKEKKGGSESDNSIIQYVTTKVPDLSNPEKYNFNYTFAGDYSIQPIKIFDDGDFTYMEFRDKNGIIPAVFTVDSGGYESVTNFRMAGQYLAVEAISPIFTLRYGSDIVCVYNETQRKLAQTYTRE